MVSLIATIEKCMDDMIKSVEQMNEPLSVIISKDVLYKDVVIDLEELKNNPRLEGAYIFKHLLGIKQMTRFKYETPKKNPEGKYNILRNMDITKREWNSLVHILKTGHPIKYLTSISKKNDFLKELETIVETSIKLGGIPYVDNYYEKILEKALENEKKTDKKKPVFPEEDTEEKFIWAATSRFPTSTTLQTFLLSHLVSEGWSLSKIEDGYHYYYKERETYESDISSVETHHVYPNSDEASTNYESSTELDEDVDYTDYN